MFETYVFGTHVQPANTDTYDDISASPTDCSFLPTQSTQPSTPQPAGLHDIIQQLSQQSLCLDDEEPQQSLWAESSLFTPSFTQMDMDGFMAEELSYVSSRYGRRIPLPASLSIPPRPSSNRGTVSCRRLQRQLNTQLQNCASHIKDISTLVEEMVSTSTQCRLLTPTPRRPSPKPEPLSPISSNIVEDEYVLTLTPTDEGYAELRAEDFLFVDESVEMGGLRRASTPSGIRKVHVVKWTKSADCASALNALGQEKVRSVPRMRNRRLARRGAYVSVS